MCGDNVVPSILYWKWDDDRVRGDGVFAGIEDIAKRSVFSHLYITTHWCHEGIRTDAMFDLVRRATDRIHELGRKIIFEIDARAEKADFCRRYPRDRTGFVYWCRLTPDERGEASKDFSIHSGGVGELFLGDRQFGEELLIAADEGGRPQPGVRLLRPNGETVRVSLSGGRPGAPVFVAFVAYYDFPDFFSERFEDYFSDLFDRYAQLPLDGVALDEMGYPWHPDFNFSPSAYETWDNGPIYSPGFAREYERRYGERYVDSLVARFCGAGQPCVRATNRYFELLRAAVVGQERFFYDRAKRCFGPDCFVGVHPTWYAIDEIDNTPEVWKNGIDWWEVPRDYGFTDEIMLMPVRTALAHRAGSPFFYNMWYGEATGDETTFYPELWRNLRYGGRTISLGYECTREKGIVCALGERGLEEVSAIEERIRLLDGEQTAGARSDVLVVVGVEASCNIAANRNKNGRWNAFCSVFQESFILSRDLFLAGYGCDLVGNYEIYNGSLFVNENGYIQYGNQEYRCAIFFGMQYCKPETADFLARARAGKSGVLVIGRADTDFDGLPLSLPCDLDRRPENLDLVPFFETYGAQRTRLPCGCVMQDGSLMFTAPAADTPIGNVFSVTCVHAGQRIFLTAEDFCYLKREEGGYRPVSPRLISWQTEPEE